jgi:PAS domain S-box-containing protein
MSDVHYKSEPLNYERDPGRYADLVQYAERERMFIALFETARYPIISKALDGTITAWNPAAERLYQYTSSEAIGRSIRIIIPTDRCDEYRIIVDKALKAEPLDDFETVRVARDGRRIDVSLSIYPIKSSAGEVIGTVKITRDITAKKISEEKFRLAVESCPGGMVMIDRGGKIMMVNGEIERLFGYRRAELIGRPVDMLVPESVRARHVGHREAFALKPETRRMGAGRELFARRKDGSEFPVEVGLNPIQTREGVLVLGVVVDISERKRIEQLKDEFVSTVSHELRTPLTSISAALGLLRGTADVKLPDATKRLITIAHSNSQRLVRLINDILDIEKMESGKVVFDLKRVEVRSLLAQAIEANRALADAYEVTLRIEESEPSCTFVHADPDRLMQVVTNLLSNAIKFSPPQTEVLLAVGTTAGGVRIAVRDHGPGIPEKFRARIFEKFAQADGSNARQISGTGLGLSIVKQIVQRLGGEAGFDDAPGGGTVFYVVLPRLESLDDADAAVFARDRPDQPGLPNGLVQTAAMPQSTG